MNDDVAFLSAAELLDAYKKRSLSPVEATRTLLDRIERLNPTLNAFLTVDHEGALRAAQDAERAWAAGGEVPLLCGVPVSIKDLVYTSWLPTTFGSLVFQDYRTDYNSPIVDRLLAAGVVVLGKTNTPEFGLLDVTRNRLRDECLNPWDLAHTAGGSSGGAGAQVAAGLGPLAVGTDGAGSIRIPAFHCGIFGLKPAFGRVAHDGWKGAPHTSHQGPMTRTVYDAALMMQATSGADERDVLSLRETPPDFLAAVRERDWRGTKVAYSLDYGYIDAEPEIRQAVLDAAELLRGLGCELIESHPPRQERSPGGIDLMAPEEFAFAVSIKPDFAEHLDELTNYGRHTIESGMSSLAWPYAQAVRRREVWAGHVRRWFEAFDFFLAPVMGETAPRCDAQRRFEEGKPWPGAFLPIFNAAGNPASSIPFGFHSNGLPLAVQIAGRGTDDAGVLQLSAAIEEARPWKQHWPAIARPEAAPTRGDKGDHMAESTIVVALDTSELSEGTIPYAVTLAKATKSRLSFVTVWEGAERALIESLPDLADDLFKRGEQYYEDYLKGIADRVRAQGVNTEAEVRTGDASDEIITVAKERKARLIALASHGRAGISRWMAGSVAGELIREAPVPALIVGPHALGQGPRAGAIRRILVPLDGSELAEESLPLAGELAAGLGAEVYLAQSLRYVTQAFMYGVPDVTIENIDEQLADAASDYLTRAMKRLPKGVSAKTAVVRGMAADSLIDLVAEHDIDLVVMATHAREGVARLAFGSVADRLVHGKAPVLMVRGEEE